MKVVRSTAPSYWASYLINGDASGLDDDEITECDKWLNRVGANGPVDCTDIGFCHSNDAGTLAGDTSEYSFLLGE